MRPDRCLNVSVRIQHHPGRAHLIPALLDRLAGFDDLEVVTDPGGPKPSSWRTHRLCLESLPDNTSHLLCLQDDAYPCDDFHPQALAALEEHPERIVCFFLPGVGHLSRRVYAAQKSGERFMEVNPGAFVPVVAIAYPREHAEALPGYADKRKVAPIRADDAVVAAYVRSMRCGALASIPSLVEHLDSEPSVMGYQRGAGRPHRRAALFVTAGD